MKNCGKHDDKNLIDLRNKKYNRQMKSRMDLQYRCVGMRSPKWDLPATSYKKLCFA